MSAAHGLMTTPGTAQMLNTTTLAAALRHNTLGVGFSGSGFLLLYFTGVSAVLKSLGIINEHTKLAGSSGGAITSARLCGGMSPFEASVREFLGAVYCRRANNCEGTLGPALQADLAKSLPAGTAERCRGRLFVAATQARPGGQGDVSVLLGPNWRDKQQVADAVLASSWIPVRSGALFTTSLKGDGIPFAYDGAFTNFLPTPPGVTYAITVSASVPDPTRAPSENLKLYLEMLTANAKITDTAQAAYLPLNPIVIPSPPKPSIYPGLSGSLPVPAAEWNNFGQRVPDNCTLVALYNQGRQDAAAFVRMQGLASAGAIHAAVAETATRPRPEEKVWLAKCGARAGVVPSNASPGQQQQQQHHHQQQQPVAAERGNGTRAAGTGGSSVATRAAAKGRQP